jgi:hypothetical protein
VAIILTDLFARIGHSYLASSLSIIVWSSLALGMSSQCRTIPFLRLPSLISSSPLKRIFSVYVCAFVFAHSQEPNGTPHGMINLALCMTVKSAELKAKKRHALEVRL